ncbi:phage tail tape measure protein [Maritalea sp.]|uniref:phage tail tape measure protein n=1 Tax=Maritalea sp. TaxID=2003361 RepID=UPI003EF2BCF5
MNDDEKIAENWRDEFDDLDNEVKRIKELADGVGKSLAAGLGDAISKGSSLRSILNNIAKSFADIALKAALKPVGGMFSDLVQGIFTGANPVLPKVQAFAKGGVINRPTFFPNSGGIGLAGEAGAEAILPLSRDSSGQLGVAANSVAPVHISMTVNATDAQSFQHAEAEIGASLLGAVRRGQRAS